MTAFRALSFAMILAACGSTNATEAEPAPTPAPTPPPTANEAPAFITVSAFCEGWCQDLCARCGDANCGATCTPRCHYGRDPNTVMDGSNPQMALAKTAADLALCLADAHQVECSALMSAQIIPDSCRTIRR